MAEKAAGKKAAKSAAPFENPLVPNARLKQMYTGIVESRLLDERLVKGRKAKLASIRGQEACRVSALVDLTEQDLVSDTQPGGVTAYLRGAELEQVVSHASAGKKKQANAAKLDAPGLLPFVEETEDRIRLALGAALAIKQLRLPHVVVIFAMAQSLRPSAWDRLLLLAAQEELPVLFVTLPESKSGKSKPALYLSARATALGVAGIPVDSSDAVALYRVVQESLGRARSHGGPALMEGVLFPAADPVEHITQSLLARRVATPGWLSSVSKDFATRLKALQQG